MGVYLRPIGGREAAPRSPTPDPSPLGRGARRPVFEEGSFRLNISIEPSPNPYLQTHHASLPIDQGNLDNHDFAEGVPDHSHPQFQ